MKGDGISFRVQIRTIPGLGPEAARNDEALAASDKSDAVGADGLARADHSITG